MAEFFQGSPPNPSPAIDLWLLSTETLADEDLAALRACLSASEQEQLEKIRLPQAQRQFLTSRGCLRHLLSRYLGQAPASLTFTYGPSGKPALSPREAGDSVTPQFNLSHSGQRLLVAISASAQVRAIGVDIEMLRSVSPLPGLCRRCLTEAEAATVLPGPSPRADHRFLRYWTGKEACLKALGLGIADSMQALELTLAAQALTPALASVAVLAASLPTHPGQLYQWQPEAGYVAALAVQSVPLTAECFHQFQATPHRLLAETALNAPWET